MMVMSDNCLLDVVRLFGYICAQYVLSDITHRRLFVASSTRLMFSVATYYYFIINFMFRLRAVLPVTTCTTLFLGNVASISRWVASSSIVFCLITAVHCV